MFARLLLVFILVPLIDLALLLYLASVTHWTWTVLLVIASGVVGAWLAKWQSQSVGTRIRQQFAQNQMPSGLLTDGAMILFAAGLLITPGLITDLFGLSLLIPRTRVWYKQVAMHFLKQHFHVQVTKMKTNPMDDGVIEGEVVESSESKRSSDSVSSTIS